TLPGPTKIFLPPEISSSPCPLRVMTYCRRGRRVPIDDPTWRGATKLGARVREQLITLDSAAGSEFGLDVLYMRLAVRPGIEPVDHQRFVILYGRRFVGAQRRRHLNAKAHQTDAEK